MLNVFSCIHVGNDSLQSQHSNQFEHSQHLNGARHVTIKDNAEHFVKGHSCRNVNNKHTKNVVPHNFFPGFNFLASIGIHVSCRKVNDDIEEETEINGVVEVIDTAQI